MHQDPLVLLAPALLVMFNSTVLRYITTKSGPASAPSSTKPQQMCVTADPL